MPSGACMVRKSSSVVTAVAGGIYPPTHPPAASQQQPGQEGVQPHPQHIVLPRGKLTKRTHSLTQKKP